jgi:hypothetical protein
MFAVPSSQLEEKKMKRQGKKKMKKRKKKTEIFLPPRIKHVIPRKGVTLLNKHTITKEMLEPAQDARANNPRATQISGLATHRDQSGQ